MDKIARTRPAAGMSKRHAQMQLGKFWSFMAGRDSILCVSCTHSVTSLPMVQCFAGFMCQSAFPSTSPHNPERLRDSRIACLNTSITHQITSRWGCHQMAPLSRILQHIPLVKDCTADLHMHAGLGCTGSQIAVARFVTASIDKMCYAAGASSGGPTI